MLSGPALGPEDQTLIRSYIASHSGVGPFSTLGDQSVVAVAAYIQLTLLFPVDVSLFDRQLPGLHTRCVTYSCVLYVLSLCSVLPSGL